MLGSIGKRTYFDLESAGKHIASHIDMAYCWYEPYIWVQGTGHEVVRNIDRLNPDQTEVNR